MARQHPLARIAAQLDRPRESAVSLGYRLPAEFEPLDVVWASLPSNPHVWPGCFDEARRQFDHFIAQLCNNVIVRTTQQRRVRTNDAWIRDYGPIFVVRHAPDALCAPDRAAHEASAGSTDVDKFGARPPAWAADAGARDLRADDADADTDAARRGRAKSGDAAQGDEPRWLVGRPLVVGGLPSFGDDAMDLPAAPEQHLHRAGKPLIRRPRPPLACHDFIFNAWGRKYEAYEDDDLVPQHLASQFNWPVWIHDMVLEGGGIDVNGRGTLLTTAQCLLNLNRNPHLSRSAIEQVLADAFGVDRFIWLHGGVAGDDTDGHIDTVARFIGPKMVAAVKAPPHHPDFDILDANWKVLEAARDQDGDHLDLLPLPAPDPPLTWSFPDNPIFDAARDRLPATYANFLIANGAVFVPIYGRKTDEQAMRMLEEAMPAYEIVGIRSEHLIVGLGSLHCMTMQQPTVPTLTTLAGVRAEADVDDVDDEARSSAPTAAAAGSSADAGQREAVQRDAGGGEAFD